MKFGFTIYLGDDVRRTLDSPVAPFGLGRRFQRQASSLLPFGQGWPWTNLLNGMRHNVRVIAFGINHQSLTVPAKR